MATYREWLVIEWSSQLIVNVYATEPEARLTAEYLAEHNPDRKYVIAETHAEVKKAGVVWTKHEPLPF